MKISYTLLTPNNISFATTSKNLITLKPTEHELEITDKDFKELKDDFEGYVFLKRLTYSVVKNETQQQTQAQQTKQEKAKAQNNPQQNNQVQEPIANQEPAINDNSNDNQVATIQADNKQTATAQADDTASIKGAQASK